jgi:hypothetical protein
MKTTKSAFGDFDESLNLDSAVRNAAQQRHREITDVLSAANLIEATFLQGSFGRKTMLKPLKDVDMVVVLHPRLSKMLRKPGGAALAMALIREAIETAFPGVRFDVEDKPAHALQVTFVDLDFTFDLVPAFADLESEDVFIANREEDTGQWERSNARTLNRVISTRNQATGGRFVHQVRMAKSFKKDHAVLDDTCGLLWEAFAHQAITVALGHSEAMARILATAAKAVTGPVLDPTGAEDLAADWTHAERTAYAAALRKAAERAQEARRLEQDGEHAAAIEVWQSLIGDPFPAAPEQSAAETLRGLAAGGITSTGRAVTSKRARQPARPSRAWRTR